MEINFCDKKFWILVSLKSFCSDFLSSSGFLWWQLGIHLIFMFQIISQCIEDHLIKRFPQRKVSCRYDIRDSTWKVRLDSTSWSRQWSSHSFTQSSPPSSYPQLGKLYTLFLSYSVAVYYFGQTFIITEKSSVLFSTRPILCVISKQTNKLRLYCLYYSILYFN